MPPTPLSPRSFHVSIMRALVSPSAIVPGRAELEGTPVTQPPYELDGTPIYRDSGSSAVDTSSGYESLYVLSSDNGTTCVRGCVKKCVKNKCVKATRRPTVTFKEEDSSTNPAISESEGQTSEESQKTSSAGEKSQAKKAKRNKSSTEASSNGASTENESSAQAEEASTTDGDTAAKSSGASTSDANASSANDDPEWSISQDCLLRGMKESDPSPTWAEIATALGKSKNAVKARWKKIKDQPAKKEPEIDSSSAAAETENDMSSEAETAEESEADSDEESDDDEEEEDEQTKPKGKGKPKPKAKSPVNNKWHKGIRNNKIAAENKKAKANAKAKASEQTDRASSGDDASSESSDVPSSGSDSQIIYGPPGKREDMRYLQDHVYKSLYPAEIHPKPDENFGRQDCDLLASLDSKYKRNRWLEMQANFFNVTGRMVPLDLIRAKCERAEAERAEKEANRAEKAAEKAAEQEKAGRRKVEEGIQDGSGKEEEEPEGSGSRSDTSGYPRLYLVG